MQHLPINDLNADNNVQKTVTACCDIFPGLILLTSQSQNFI